MASMKDKRVKLVTWVDSSTLNRGGWCDRDMIAPEPLCTIKSVGWIVQQDPKHIVLAGCDSDGGQLSRLTAIPRGCILSVISLRESKRNQTSFRKKQT